MRLLIALLAVLTIAIGLYLILGSRGEVVIDKDSWAAQLGKLQELPDGSPSALKTLINDLRDSTENDLRQKNVEAIQDRAKDALEDVVDDLKELTDDLQSGQDDSPEYQSWKENARNCAQQLEKALTNESGAAEPTTKDNAVVQGEAAATAKTCVEELQTKAQTLADEEREKANEQTRKFQIIVGTALVIVGAAMLIFGNPAGTYLLASGAAMLGCAFDKDCGKDDGSSDQPPGVSSTTEAPNYTPTKADQDAGFESAGSSKDGGYVFLHSSREGRWKVVDRESHDIVIGGDFSKTTGYESKVTSVSVLNGCDITISGKEKVSFVTRAGARGCPNFEIQRVDGVQWIAVDLQQVPLQNADDP